MTETSKEKLPYPQIVVAGAGSVGCFVGGMLARGAHHVTLLVRPRVDEDWRGKADTDGFEGLMKSLRRTCSTARPIRRALGRRMLSL